VSRWVLRIRGAYIPDFRPFKSSRNMFGIVMSFLKETLEEKSRGRSIPLFDYLKHMMSVSALNLGQFYFFQAVF
jgi:hypothetical protein